MTTSVVVALITGAFSVVVALIGKLMQSNKRDHSQVLRMLIRIDRKLERHVNDKNAH